MRLDESRIVKVMIDPRSSCIVSDHFETDMKLNLEICGLEYFTVEWIGSLIDAGFRRVESDQMSRRILWFQFVGLGSSVG